ncbi:transglutaminase superfamily protein [Pseudonocardia sediminis]|uniref:Transglutaminase superfamily protein n=1 Tax=Pseudonocardia sediminis TaxID=1397368 RepID=A0A4Q7UVC9_PSEST|nr:transglutaminase family protein [Pseudonocardia sediminis]RZT84888.1 transglutaminase superfamily protein [Pseudonocardia sediminis]
MSLTTTSDTPQPADLAPAGFVDSDSTEVRAFTARVTEGVDDPVERAVALFTAVRDEIWYDPFCLVTEPAACRASAIAEQGNNWCVPKAVLLTAAARAAGIPARLGFADVRNHLNTERLRARMGGADLFVFHGYTALHLDGRWVKATPAFNAELCARFGVDPIDFDGRTDALMHPYDGAGDEYMEYVHDRGQYTDLPLDELLTTFREHYGEAMFAADDRGADTFTR